MPLNELRRHVLYLSVSPPGCQPFLNRWLAGQRGYAKAVLERFDQFEFSDVIGKP